MPDEKPFPPPLDGPQADGGDFKPWEQRIGPGMGGGVSVDSGQPAPEEPEKLARACQNLGHGDLEYVVDHQTDLANLPMVDRHTAPDAGPDAGAGSNEDVWRLFVEEHLYDTRRVTLEHVHLFEWFPAAPGTFHTAQARRERQMAYRMMEPIGDQVYFSPAGKASMIRGGVGAVRLRPREIAGEAHYFMTASSNGVCHEGFPVLVPRRFYGPLKARILDEGAAPVTLSGEMRYVREDTATFFGQRRQIPLLYLHVDDLQILEKPRSDVTAYLVSVAVSFAGEFEGHQGLYATFASFDPAERDGLAQASAWLGQVYVAGQHQGMVITDFDEVRPCFPDAVFGLPELMAGKLDRAKVAAWLQSQGYDAQAGKVFFVNYQEINTQGGAYIAGDLHIEGDFIGRDQIVHRGSE
jgi:hypothetical protein